ncbi:MAG: LysR family transcriptional regulator [Deltaproteobacteria bacterium]|nr:LysR family transcriptional regulator [Deltaproteobacteria bacterium]HDM09996.1 LysR family transcriptional regulator [Desulfobacteraceae bacterium]
MTPKKKVRKPSIDFDLRQLEIFCKVVELRSFSKAAKEVYLAQASVSERIATLEQMVGARLLDRLGRTVVPTAAGQRLYKHAVSLLEMKRKVCLEMEDFLGLKRGEIRIGGSTIPGEYILPRLIGKFHQAYPGISVTLFVGDTEQVESKVAEGHLEIGVIGSKSSRPNMYQKELWEDELVVAIPTTHEWAKRKEVSVEELSREPFIARERGSGTLKMFQDHLKPSGKVGFDHFNVVASLGSSTAVKEAIKSGLGISVLSHRAIETEVKAGILKELKINDLPIRRKFYLIRDRRRAASPLCRELRDFLLQTAQ